MSTKDRYLGDGVYASFDGYHIWLAVNHHTNRVVALEPAVYDSLRRFVNEEILSRQETEVKPGTAEDSSANGQQG